MSGRRVLAGRPVYDDSIDPAPAYEYVTPHGTWHSSEPTLIIGPYGPESVRRTSSGQPAMANGPGSRTIWRASDEGRAMEYVRRGLEQSITTNLPGDFHRHPVHRAAYYTTSERYADQYASRGNNSRGMLIQQAVPSALLDRAYVFPETPTNDWRSTVLSNREQAVGPRRPAAIRESRQRDVVIGPTAQVETGALLRRTRRYPSGPAYDDSFGVAREPLSSSSDDSDIDEHRRESPRVQQLRFQGDALEELRTLPRHARRAQPSLRRR